MASNTEWLETEYQAAWKAMREAQKEAQYREIAFNDVCKRLLEAYMENNTDVLKRLKG